MHIHSLPRELLLHIVELTITTNPKSDRDNRKTLFTLALVSPLLSNLVSYILYHTVFLTSPRAVRLLSRTAQTDGGRKKLGKWVENLFVGEIHFNFRTPVQVRDDQLQSILRSVPNVRKLALHESAVHALIGVGPDIRPTHLEFSTLSTLPSNLRFPPTLFERATHLSFASPGEKWVDPVPFLSSLPLTSSLTHIALARREHSNTENDIIFTTAILSLLSSSYLQRIVVRMFPTYEGPGAENDTEADIWRILNEAIGFEKRVIMKNGSWDAWKEEWEDGVKGRRCPWERVRE